ncbi:MAG: WD40 repeat domain-containing protein [Deltaproteobacteria bacterium]|nr:WD40 repeat domain-containing protein [Deltaproteobacteria bacterium]
MKQLPLFLLFFFCTGCYQVGSKQRNDSETEDSVARVRDSDSTLPIDEQHDSVFGQAHESDNALSGTEALDGDVANVPTIKPDVVQIDDLGTIYMMVKESNSVYRYSVVAGEWLPQINLGVIGSVQSMAVSNAHERLYLGFQNGQIMYTDLIDGNTIQQFAIANYSVDGFAAVGDYLLAEGREPNSTINYHWIFAEGGWQTDANMYGEYSRRYAWDPALGRVYFFEDSVSPSRLNYETIEQGEGLILDPRNATFKGDYETVPPIVISPDGRFIFLGSGDIFDGRRKNRFGSINTHVADAVWTIANGIVAIVEKGDNSELRSITMDGTVLRSEPIGGQPVAVVQHTDGNVYTVTLQDGNIKITGATIVDAALELARDPNIPVFTPTAIDVDNRGIVYLLIRAERSIYRFDTSTRSWLSPLVLDGTDIIQTMAVSKAHDRLYTGYRNGEVRYLELPDGETELPFTNIYNNSVEAIADVGNFILVQDDCHEWRNQWIFDSDANRTSLGGNGNLYSRAYSWDSVKSRVYFLRDGITPNDLLFEEIDQTSGKITMYGETPYSYQYDYEPPIVISPDGAHVLIGTGDIYSAETMELNNAISSDFIDAAWVNSDWIHMLNFSGINSEIFTISKDATVLKSEPVEGTPIELIQTPDGGVFAVTSLNGQIKVTASTL